jgi:basic amino acid/polyamine antiporter, APA family
MTPAAVHAVAALLIGLVGTLNYLGVRRAAAVMSVATVIKYAAVLGVGLLALTVVRAPEAVAAPQAPAGGSLLTALGMALVPVMYAYDGWVNLSLMGGEVAQPVRTLPRGLIIGTCCVIAAYLLVNLGFWHALPAPQMASSPLVAVTVVTQVPWIGRAGAAVMAALVILSAFSGLNGSMMTDPRVLYAMADRGLFFRALARVSPRFQSPSVALGVSTLLASCYVLQSDFAHLADCFILGAMPFYALAVAGVYVLRLRRPDMPRPVRTWGYPVVPALFLLASAGMLGAAVLTDPWDILATLLVILAGVPVYFLWKRLAERPAVSTPAGSQSLP